jgi:succinate-acetate transporter protein
MIIQILPALAALFLLYYSVINFIKFKGTYRASKHLLSITLAITFILLSIAGLNSSDHVSMNDIGISIWSMVMMIEHMQMSCGNLHRRTKIEKFFNWASLFLALSLAFSSIAKIDTFSTIAKAYRNDIK